jgi:hypothetical protein
LNGSLSLDTSPKGFNFLTVDAEVSGPAANWANGTSVLVYW